MRFRLIRSAMFRLEYGGVSFLTDPMLGSKYSIRAMGDSSERNPTVELPCSIDEVLHGVDAVIVSHLHPDHFDQAAFGILPRTLPVYCQPSDVEALAEAAFDARPLIDPTHFRGVELKAVGAQHGSGTVLERMGSVMGVVFRAVDEPTVYWAGDTVMCDEVLSTIREVRPDVIVTHSAGAMARGVRILTDADETIEIVTAAPNATVVAIHLDAVGHATVSRDSLRARATQAGLPPDRLLIPADGQTLTLQ